MRPLILHGLAVAVAALALAGADRAHAQSDAEPVFSIADITDGAECAVLRVGFNFPVTLVGSVPIGSGSELRVRVRAAGAGPTMVWPRREATPPPRSTIAPITKIAFEGDQPEGPILDISFARPVFFQVGQGGDFRSITVAFANHNDRGCTPALKPMVTIQDAAAIEGKGRALPKSESTAQLSPQTQILLQDARKALTGKDYVRAVQLLTLIEEAPDGKTSPEAQELLGLARERSGQLAHAKTEYETFLRRFPNSAAVGRVRQRLAAVLARDAATPQKLRQLGRYKDPGGGVAWTAGGSLAEYFYYDAGYNRSQAKLDGLTTSSDLVNQEQWLTTIDGVITARSPDFIARGRVSATLTNDMLSDTGGSGLNGASRLGSVSALYLEGMTPGQGLFGRLGRQSRSTGGVLGRFDGGLFSARVTPMIKLEVAGGLPVDSPRILHLQTDRPFFATSLVFGPFDRAWSGDVYFARQSNHSLVDREAVGAEVRYLAHGGSVFALTDYDVHFKRLNYALLNASTVFKDNTSLSLALDYRQSPLLTSQNALIQQPFGSIASLIPIYGAAGIYQLALDRTASSRSATLSLSRPLTSRFLINADATVAYYGGTPASGGVAAMPSLGIEEYASAQLVGNNLIKSGDIGIVGLIYANSANAERYALDLDARYPITQGLRINPRLIFSFQQNKMSPGNLYALRPSLRINYFFRQHYEFELEGGGEFTSGHSPFSTDQSLGRYFDIGLRADF